MDWDEGTHTYKVVLYGLNFPLAPKEGTLQLSYHLAQMWCGREVGVMCLKSVKS